MKAVFYIEYHTVWGENMRLRAMGKNYPMQYTPGDIWKVEIGGLKSGRNFEYRYEVEKDGICVKAEWKSHNIFVPSKAKDAASCNNSHVTCAENTKDTIEVRDFWSDVPEDLPLNSAPFADGVFRTEPGKTWKAAGTAIPVFSLRSEKSFGVGEFCDIRLLADWAAMTGQKVLQLLPVNDTTMTDSWFDSYPYKANSIYALHPQFINLVEAGKEADEEYTELLAELNALPDVDYERVNLYKRTYLRELFARKGKKDLESEGFRKFFEENGYWLMPYAVFCCLRDKYRTADFSLWKGYEKYSEKKARKYCEEHPDEVGVWYFTQYHLHLQLADARAYARSKGVILKGDLPIGISRTSADAWLHGAVFRCIQDRPSAGLLPHLGDTVRNQRRHPRPFQPRPPVQGRRTGIPRIRHERQKDSAEGYIFRQDTEKHRRNGRCPVRGGQEKRLLPPQDICIENRCLCRTAERTAGKIRPYTR